MTSPSSLSNCHGPWYHAQLSPVAGSLWHSVEASRRASAAVEAIGSSTGGRVTRSSPRLFPPRERARGDQPCFDSLEALLNELVLHDRCELRQFSRPEGRPVPLARGSHEEGVPLASEDPLQHGQPTAAWTRPVELGPVADLVTKHRHRVVVERGHEHPPRLTGTTRLTPLVHHLDEHRFGLNVIVLVGRTLERDDPDFLRAVDVDDGQIPRASALLARLRGEHLA